VSVDPDLNSSPPKDLAKARAIAHRVVQLLSLAARANLPPQPDDGHSSLVWDRETRRFSSHPIMAEGQALFVTAGVWPLSLGLNRGGESEDFPLSGNSLADASAWLDAQLERNGLMAAGSIATPYELPAEVSAIEIFQPEASSPGLRALSSWFDLADGLLTAFASSQSGLTPGPSPVRCWPHHFDIATYVSLEEGDAENARGVGVGMSPGDESYGQPYFYVNPWPKPGVDGLPELRLPGQWHTEGFVGAIATAERALELGDTRKELTRFLDAAFSTAVGLLLPG
jgi:hypothetical protein